MKSHSNSCDDRVILHFFSEKNFTRNNFGNKGTIVRGDISVDYTIFAENNVEKREFSRVTISRDSVVTLLSVGNFTTRNLESER